MKLQDNTILITGGSSGIGLELARVLIEKGNKVLICGRSLEKLEKAKSKLPTVIIFQCDVSKQCEREKLAGWVAESHPKCNILINNAAFTHTARFRDDENIIQKADEEIQTNLMAPIALTKMFLPIIESNKNPAFINVTTGLVYVPKAAYPIYNATKAALHSFTKVLRKQLENDPIEIIEVLMTVVDTPFHHGNAPKIAISPQKAVSEMIRKLEKGEKVIRIDKVNLLYLLSRIAPRLAFNKLNSVN